MAKSKSAKNPEILAESARNIFSGIVAFFTIVILSGLPLYYQDHYFNILRAKYSFYYITVLGMLGVCFIVALAFCFIDRMEYGGVNTRRFFHRLHPKELWKNLTVVDKALLLFLLFAIISTIQSDYLYEAFWGNEGRFSGLFLITLYVSSVFVIGKLGKIKKWYLDVFLFVGVLVCLFGITDYFRMDLFHWKAGVKVDQADIFTSTIGNVNTYTAYVALVMGVACGLFATEKNVWRTICYVLVIAIAFIAMITGQSDNAYLALGALFGLLPFALFGTRQGIKRYTVLVALFATAIKSVSIINALVPEKVIGILGIFEVLSDYSKLTYIVVALWILVAVLYIWDCNCYKKNDVNKRNEKKIQQDKIENQQDKTENQQDDKVGAWLRISWLIFVLSAVMGVAWVLYDANWGGHAERYQAFSKYLVFNDSWGTNRGFCWRIGWESYMQQPFMHKLFGFGPDTFGILTWGFRDEALKTYGIFYESAHNEYFQYLVTMGPFALISYLAFLFTGGVMMVKNLAKTPWVLAPLVAVICYGAQAFVNINLPIATPIMWTLLAIGLAMCRKE